MKINLGDIIPTSTLDWPGKVVLVIFTRGCPFRCRYCSNARFVSIEDSYIPEDTDKAKKEIMKASNFIDGIVISGGEPFEQPKAIMDIAAYAKSLGLMVGAQTNGMYPDRMGTMIEDGLLDAVLLDIKAPLELEPYSRVTGYQSRPDILKAVTASLLTASTARKDGRLVYFEVRTTVFRGIADKPADLARIATAIPYCDAYILQQGRPEIAADEAIQKLEPVSRNELKSMARSLLPGIKPSGIKTIKVRTRELGDETVYG